MTTVRPSLKKKILVPLLLVLIATLTVAAVENVWSFKAHLTTRLQQRANRIADLIGFIAGSAQKPAELQHLISALGGEAEVNLIVVLVGKPARVVASSRMEIVGKSANEMTDSDLKTELSEAMTLAPGAFHFDRQGDEFDYFEPLSVATQGPGGQQLQRGAVVVSLDTRPLRRQVLELTGKAILGDFVAVLVLAVSCWVLLNRHVLRPVKEIGNAVTHFHAGNATRISGATVSSHEFSELTGAWNGLMDRIEREEEERTRAEAALRESEARLQVAIHASNLGPWDWNLITDKVHFSPEWKRQLGFADEEIAGHFDEFRTRLHAEDYDRIMSAVQAFMEDRNKGYDVEFRMRHKDGFYRWIHTRATMLFDAADKPIRMLGCHLDITERKLAENALRESKRFAESIAENSTSLIYLLDLETGRNTYSNRGVGEFLGYSPAQMIEMGDNVLPTIIHPEDLPRVMQHYAQFADVRDRRVVDLEYRVKHTSGDWHWVWVRDTVFNRRPNGATWQIMGTVQDITERKQADAQRERLADIVEASPDFIGFADPKTRQIQYINRHGRRMCGIGDHEDIGKFKISDVHPAWMNNRFAEVILPAAVRDGFWEGEGAFLHRNGREIPVSMVLLARKGADGEVDIFYTVSRDITERKLSEAALEKAHKELVDASRQAGMAEVATSVLHNVGNVLNSVNTSMSIATDKVGQFKAAGLGRVAALLNEHAENLPAFFAEHPQGVRLPKFLTQLAGHFATEQQAVLGELASLRTNLEHINEIVATQQSYAGAGGLVEVLPLAEVIDDALRMNAGALERHGTQVVRDFDRALPPIALDRNKLLLILVNLIRNAKYACTESGVADKRITVRAHLNGNGLAKISVSDSGIGIPAENLTRIFEHGFTTRKAGHGFGLHSSALAARDMGGSLRVHSDGLGHGATFTIELPVTPTNS
jgi:PAS domain S-box-containing protein